MPRPVFLLYIQLKYEFIFGYELDFGNSQTEKNWYRTGRSGPMEQASLCPLESLGVFSMSNKRYSEFLG